MNARKAVIAHEFAPGHCLTGAFAVAAKYPNTQVFGYVEVTQTARGYTGLAAFDSKDTAASDFALKASALAPAICIASKEQLCAVIRRGDESALPHELELSDSDRDAWVNTNAPVTLRDALRYALQSKFYTESLSRLDEVAEKVLEICSVKSAGQIDLALLTNSHRAQVAVHAANKYFDRLVLEATTDILAREEEARLKRRHEQRIKTWTECSDKEYWIRIGMGQHPPENLRRTP